MPKIYRDFPFLPDFSRAPKRGLIDEKSGPSFSHAPEFIEYPWESALRTFSYAFTFTAADELDTVKRRLQEIGGRYSTINLPTWERDFELAVSITSGDREIEITKTTAGYVADFLPNDREDTPGRILYFWAPGQIEAHITRIINVKASATEPATQETVVLEDALPFAVTGSRDWYGWAVACRSTADDNEYRYLKPRVAALTFEARQLRAHILKDDSTTLDEVAAPTATSEAWATIVVTDADGSGDYGRTHSQTAECEGPTSRLAVVHPFRSDWRAWRASGGIRIEQTSATRYPYDDVNGSLSGLTTGAVSTSHISFCFDVDAEEVLAWEVTGRGAGETFQIRHYDTTAVTRGPFSGFSPALVFNQVVVQPPTDHATDSDVVCIYLKSNNNSLFCRIDRDNFATEVELAELPFKLVRLIGVTRATDTLVITGIDEGLRKVVITSAVYA